MGSISQSPRNRLHGSGDGRIAKRCGVLWEISEAAFGKNMDAVLETIAAELRSQYSIGYYPNHPVKDGKWHSVRIRMKNPDYFARARKEYLDK